MDKVCNQCGNGYGAERSTSKYCSAQCRKLAFQGDSENAKAGTLRTELKEQVNKVYQEFREANPKRGKDIKAQSYNSMMVGYVPPQERGG